MKWDPAYEPTLEWLLPGDLEIPEYQRELLINHVVNLQKNWKCTSCGALIVVRRSDGTLMVVDGQQRLEAILRNKFDRVPCLVYEGLSPEEEAAMFSDHNGGNGNRKAVNALNVFRADLMANDPIAIKIHDICLDNQFQIPKAFRKDVKGMNKMLTVDFVGNITAVKSLRNLYEQRGENPKRHCGTDLKLTLNLIRRVWAEQAFATSRNMIVGVGLLIDRCGTEFTEAVFCRVFKSITAQEIVDEAQTLAAKKNRTGGFAPMQSVYLILRDHLVESDLTKIIV